MKFDQLVQYKALDRLHTISASFPVERLPDAEIQKLEMKNVCALLPLPVFEQLEAKCGMLGLSKREFIEAVLIESFSKVDQIVDQVGLHQAMWEATYGAPYPGDEIAAQMHRDSQEVPK